MENGFLRLSRSFFDCPFWEQERSYSMAEAWLDLLQMARYDEKPAVKILASNKDLTINRGEIHASIRFLSSRWGWGLERTQKFIDMCKKSGAIERRTEHHESILKLCNYDKYNPLSNINPNISPNINPNINRTSARTNNKKDKERKKRKEREEYVNDPDYDKFLLFLKWIDDNAPSVAQMKEPFTFQQYKAIRTEYAYDFIQSILFDMHNWQDLLKKRVSANLTFKKWAKKNQ
ncbi:MAG: hypothetical protein LBG19_03250 [Prevotellaceae bacterium]|jgi:hypothetical protein|nr:hypothetical protein [Prevotellaceae bacterium]